MTGKFIKIKLRKIYKNTPLRVGDKVEVIGRSHYHGFKDREIVTVIEIISSTNVYCTNKKGLNQAMTTYNLKKIDNQI